MSACLLKLLSLGISLCSDYANFTAKANAFALARIECLGRQATACDCMYTHAHTHTHTHTVDSKTLTAHYVSDRDPDGRHEFHSLYHIVIDSCQA